LRLLTAKPKELLAKSPCLDGYCRVFLYMLVATGAQRKALKALIGDADYRVANEDLASIRV
jgi:hypothetical protein